MKYEKNYVSLKAMQALDPAFVEWLESKIEVSAWWLELYYTHIPRDTVRIIGKDPNGIEIEFILEKDLEDSFSKHRLGMDDSGHYGVNSKVPTFTFQELWNLLPDKIKGYSLSITKIKQLHSKPPQYFACIEYYKNDYPCDDGLLLGDKSFIDNPAKSALKMLEYLWKEGLVK